MDKRFSDFIKLARTPGGEDVSYLSGLVDEHPYCQPTRMLLARALQGGDARDAGKHLSIAMAVAPDRRIFRAYLKDRHPMLQAKSNASVTVEVTGDVGHDTDKKVGKAVCSKDRKLRQSSIIDRFLEKNPRIEVRRDDVPDGDLFRESIEYKEGVASETLAEILLRQGKKQEAAMIYQQLSLMFPEKSSYFAKKLRNI